MSLPNNLYEDSFAAQALELVVKDVLPRPQVQLAVRDGDNYLTAHDLPFVVGVSVILAGTIMVIPFRRSIERGQLLQPFVIIAV